MPTWHAPHTASQCVFCWRKPAGEVWPLRRTKFCDERRPCDNDALPPSALAVSTTAYMVPTDVTQVRRPPRTLYYVRREDVLLNDAESTPSEHPNSEKVRGVFAERVPDGPDALHAL